MLPNFQAEFAKIRQEILGGNLVAVLTRFSDLVIVAAVGLIIGMMIVPLPTQLLDIFLTINITAAITILMVSIYIARATQIASYPTILLLTTLYRLALDISATRLILLQADAGEVIQAFGMFVVGGNFVVGAVIFLIITLVQFIVITKGAERVAEVSARFSLDAMPGKQMSIDADMRAGIIDFDVAKSRRDELARESQFYGAMDGAMKFVKGDAIAGIIITVINIVGGLVIGVLMRDMEVLDAVQTYSILTIGNGLVSQIPALLISISAGMVVTRVASENKDANLGTDVAGQILAQPKAIRVASGLLFIVALIPGMPKIPFLILAGATGVLAYGLFRALSLQETAAAVEAKPALPVSATDEPELSVTVPLVLEVSEALTPYVDVQTEDGRHFFERLVEVRNNLYAEMGVIFPPIQVAGNCPYDGGTYLIYLNEVPTITGSLRLDSVLVNDTASAIFIYGIKGQEAVNPGTGKPAAWVSKDQRDRAENAGLEIWDTGEILILHLTHFLRKNAREFIGIQEVQWMVDTMKRFYPNLVDEVVPKPVSLQTLTEILQRLVDEETSIRDLKTIFQTLSEWGRTERDVLALTEHVRTALRRKICFQITQGKTTLYVYQLDPEIEEMFRNSIRQSANGAYLAMEPGAIQQVMDAAYVQIGNLPPTAQKPVVITDQDIRRFVKRLLDYNYPEITVLSWPQITKEISVQPLGMISLVGQHRLVE
ncbi:MAG: type III secretion system export apparatus subunit SctV [Bryobacteraceae bacterium]